MTLWLPVRVEKRKEKRKVATFLIADIQSDHKGGTIHNQPCSEGDLMESFISIPFEG